ncbi:peptidoglycan-binding domain-containing protein [Bosea sp. NBC_00550]|uniref:peptidoglycan-binding domain-containing protein n=1 Tax=Bosea sp. NBC_00550 TaxID=2969621 RepID=UPI002232305A|nr:peptidoglycan-binding domain-containing protein [Bosea sp. NBC_00550]UZF95711.1 peptidoglycan-binding protein [Bosea sp. NBC_00550]
MNTRDVQAALGALGCSLVVDGKPGPKTKKAIIAFQRVTGLYPDGITGPETINALQVPSSTSL